MGTPGAVEKIGVVLVDDHDLLREALKNSLQASGRVEVIAEARNAAECWDVLSRHAPDVLVLDLALPGRGGGDVLVSLRQRYPQIKVLVLSAHQEDEYAIQLIRLGANGYVHKSASLDELNAAIDKIHSGGIAISEDLTQLMARHAYGDGPGALHESLSMREREVMLMLARNKRVTAIARDLGLSVKTISTYRKRILEKLDLVSNEEITAYARLQGMLDDDP